MATTRKKVLERSVHKRGKPAARKSTRLLSPAAAFLAAAHPAVRTELAQTVDLPMFRQTLGGLDKADRLRLVEQALVLLEQNYVHLPLKQAMHAVRPIQRLRLLHQRIEVTPEAELPSELRFHQEMLDIFTSVRDLHTNYLLPDPFNRMTAFLPFLVESYFEGGARRYLVSHVMEGFDEPPFATGVELLSWNGVPIGRAIELNADRFAGSNEEARRARGIERLTIRPLIVSLPPDEDRVIVAYRGNDGQEHELRVDWLVFSPDVGGGGITPVSETTAPAAAAMGIDLEAEVAGRAKKVLFAPHVLERQRRRTSAVTEGAAFDSQRAELSARVVDTAEGRFGYIRIWTFAPEDRNEPLDAFLESFIGEFIRLAEALPQSGLIVDVRGNGGGVILAGELLLQLMTPNPVESERLQFINTPLNLDLCERHAPSNVIDLSPWMESIAESVRTGATYSRAFPITSADAANSIGQRYHGPVVLITDARCYSTTDIFAAGFQDHEIGPVLGVDLNTGAGGANVWGHDLLSFLLPGQAGPYEPLPNNAQMRVAIRRTLRVGDQAGTPVEDLGVVPDQHHELTRDDLLNGNVDLIERAAEILAGIPVRQLQAELVPSPDDLVVRLTTRGIARLDIYADGRPQGSLDWSDGTTEVTIDGGAESTIRLVGFDEDEVVAARTLAI